MDDVETNKTMRACLPSGCLIVLFLFLILAILYVMPQLFVGFPL